MRLAFFVEEQLVATPVAVASIVVLALAGQGALQDGWALLATPTLLSIAAVGVLSQLTGLFGGLVLLDARETSFCVPVNRGASVLAGVVATASLAVLGAGRWPTLGEVAGGALILLAIFVLWTRGSAAHQVRDAPRSRG